MSARPTTADAARLLRVAADRLPITGTVSSPGAAIRQLARARLPAVTAGSAARVAAARLELAARLWGLGAASAQGDIGLRASAVTALPHVGVMEFK